MTKEIRQHEITENRRILGVKNRLKKKTFSGWEVSNIWKVDEFEVNLLTTAQHIEKVIETVKSLELIVEIVAFCICGLESVVHFQDLSRVDSVFQSEITIKYR